MLLPTLLIPGHTGHPNGAKSEPVSTGPKILVIDDNEDIREAVVDSLEDAGYNVSVAANGAIAIGALRASEDLPFLILLDLMMPVMDGAQFLQEMRKDPRLSALPVVVVTADGSATKKAAALGTHGGLRKPVQLDELLSTVSKYHRHD
jgi:CheY-like chemotaxis protein